MTAAGQAALKLYPNRPNIEYPQHDDELQSAFVSGHSEGINHAIATLRGLGYTEAADILEQELFVSTPENPVPKKPNTAMTVEKASELALTELGWQFCNNEHEVDVFNAGFSRGAEWQVQQDGWIEITPEVLLTLFINKTYLVCNSYTKDQHTAYLNTRGNWMIATHTQIVGVTHYRELPEPPKTSPTC